VSVVDDDYVYAAVVGAAFFRIVAGDGHTVGETGDLEALLVDAKGGKVAKDGS
jgi:hypothetical protein